MNNLLANISPINNPAIPNMPKDPAQAPSVLGGLISGVVNILLIFAAIWVFVQFLWAGFLWINSAGDKDKLEQSRSRMINAVIGLIIVFSSWAIYILILNFLGITTGSGVFFTLMLLTESFQKKISLYSMFYIFFFLSSYILFLLTH